MINALLSVLRQHQLIIIRSAVDVLFEKFDDKLRGLLLWHTVGSGKTITALSLCAYEQLRIAKNTNVKVKVILPNSIRGNFEADANKLESLTGINFDITFITMDSPKLVTGVNESIKDGDYVIIDECHNLTNAIVNGSERSYKAYVKLKETNLKRLYCLTGTPVINDPYELVPIYNLLLKDKSLMLPENYIVFNDNIQNGDVNMFTKINVPLISYYDTSDPEFFKHLPTDLGIEVVKIPMTENQKLDIKFELYKSRQKRSLSLGSARRNIIPSISKTFHTIATDDTYFMSHTSTRMLNIRSLKDDVSVCPKYNAIINHAQNDKCLVFCEFKNEYGLDGFKEFLNRMGRKDYAIISGDLPTMERDIIRDRFNDENGDINILMITKSGAEGLNLRGIRKVFIMSMYWRWSLIWQVIGRAIRYKSHDHLDENDRNVKTYIYISYDESGAKTMDEIVLDVADSKQEKIDAVLKYIKEHNTLQDEESLLQLWADNEKKKQIVINPSSLYEDAKNVIHDIIILED